MAREREPETRDRWLRVPPWRSKNRNERNRGVAVAGGLLRDVRGSARGRRLNLPTCAHLYIYIYTRLTSIPSLFFIPLSSGVVVATPPLPAERVAARWWCSCRRRRRLRLLPRPPSSPSGATATGTSSSPDAPNISTRLSYLRVIRLAW